MKTLLYIENETEEQKEKEREREGGTAGDEAT
jgi:hypothetical protein